MLSLRFLGLLLLFASVAFSQNNPVIDSLEIEFQNADNYKDKVKNLKLLSSKTWISDPEKSKEYTQNLIKISKANDYKKGLAVGNRYMGVICTYTLEYDKALKYLNKALVISKELNDPDLQGTTYTSLGILYYFQYDFYNSFINYDNALAIYRKENNVEAIANSLINISVIYFKTKDYGKSLEYALNTNKILENSTNYSRIAYSFQQTTECYAKLGNVELAKVYANKAIVFSKKDNNLFQETYGQIALAKAYYLDKSYKQSLEILTQIQGYIKTCKDNSLLILYYYDLSKVYYELGDYENVLIYGEKSYDLSALIKDNLAIYEASKILAQANGKKNNYKESKKYYELHDVYADSLEGNNFYKGRLDHELKEANYRNAKDKEIAIAEQKKAVAEQKNLLLKVVAGFLFLFALLAIILYFKINKLYKKANAGNKTKSVFISKINHEIKTPLTSILGFSNLLEDTNLSDEQSTFNKGIIESSNRLLKISNEILEFSNLKNQKLGLSIQSENLNEVLLTINKMYLVKIEDKNIEYHTEFDFISHELNFDRIKLLLILTKLMDNAVKFTNQGFISFSVKLVKDLNNEFELLFSVTDSGKGISDLHIQDIQGSFYQVTNNEADNVGIGLGLTVVRKNLELMNSELEIESEIEKGSTFSFKLSLKKGKKITSKIDEVTSQDTTLKNTSLKFLIVEDNKLTSLLIEKILSIIYDNSQIHQAYNGQEGLDLYKKEKPDLIIMDLQMPVLNGFEATAAIRKSQKTHVPIIACSATLMTENKEKCKEYGIDDYIEKPINKDLLKIILNNHLNCNATIKSNRGQ